MNTSNSNKWYAFVPNLITLLNLASGVVGVYFAFANEIQIALLLMVVGAIFDFFDGFAARILKVSGELGKQLDSLADLITFGLLPGVMVFAVQRELVFDSVGGFNQLSPLQWYYILVPILIPIFSALRLGKFNIDTRQTSSFIGVPTPANALFFASFMWSIQYSDFSNLLAHPILIQGLVILFSILMISEIPLFALKFKNFKWKGNEIRFIFLAISLILLIWLQIPGISVIILIYILLSIITRKAN